MFTGLVERMGQVTALDRQGPGLRLQLAVAGGQKRLEVGQSVAVSGCCLTVVQRQQDRLAVDVGPETLGRTNLGDLQIGAWVNLERSLRAGQPIDGHLVTGHVDVVGHLGERRDEGSWSLFRFALPAPHTRHMAAKGSVAVDGVSLTLVEVWEAGFSVQLIPHTLAVTTLGKLQVGDAVNIETDILAKYVEAQLRGLAGRDR